MTDDEWMDAQDRQRRLATFARHTKAWGSLVTAIPEDVAMAVAMRALDAREGHERTNTK